MGRLSELVTPDEGYELIKAKDIQDQEIQLEHREAVKCFFKIEKGGVFFPIIFLTIFSVLWTSSCIPILFSFETLINGGILFILADIFIIYMTFYQIRNYSQLKKGEFKAQYGVVKSKYSKNSSGKNHNIICYINVNFESTMKTINNVSIKYLDYLQLDKDDRVLVITYNNKTAHAINIED